MAKKKYKKKQAIKQKAKKPGSNRLYYLSGMIVVMVIGIAIIFWLSGNRAPKTTIPIDLARANIEIIKCLKNPIFPQQSGLNPPYAIDLRQDMHQMGLGIIDANTGRRISLPGWDSFGYLGLYTLDNNGNIYTSPVPYVSIDINPPEEQNRILRVDHATGEMIELLRLPSDNPPTPNNPFGVIGLAFDCETNSLYATSVSGSTFRDESGKVFQIDPVSRQILDTYDGFDALGIALYYGNDGKRAYLGHARRPEIHSVGIDEKGGFKNDKRFELSLVDVPHGSFNKAHRIIIKNDIMTLRTREFSYTLITAGDVLRTTYTFAYNNELGKWDYVGQEEDK